MVSSSSFFPGPMQIPHLVAALIAAPFAVLAAQQTAPPTSGFEFTLKNIMRGPELYGRAPQRVAWTPDGRWIYFLWAEPGTDWREPLRPFRVRALAGSRPERVTDLQMDSVGPLVTAGSFSPDRRFKAVSYEGDLHVVDLTR